MTVPNSRYTHGGAKVPVLPPRSKANANDPPCILPCSVCMESVVGSRQAFFDVTDSGELTPHRHARGRILASVKSAVHLEWARGVAP